MVVATRAETLEVLVTGMPTAGKSTFIETISKRVSTAHGWFWGKVGIDDQMIMQFLEPPQQHQFDFIWLRELIAHVDVPAFIVIADSTAPEYFGAVVGLLETIRHYHPQTPLALVLNRIHEPDAWLEIDVRLGLGIPDDILVVGADVRRKNDVKDVVVALLYKILG